MLFVSELHILSLFVYFLSSVPDGCRGSKRLATKCGLPRVKWLCVGTTLFPFYNPLQNMPTLSGWTDRDEEGAKLFPQQQRL